MMGQEQREEYTFFVSMFQIYNENAYDLLNFVDDRNDDAFFGNL